ncbi:Transcription initiation factor TFIID subunit 10 [Lobosporangium transversale]|nr:Transcription initiation factor TFIID subunit 10 [Lobosporangium transversale]
MSDSFNPNHSTAEDANMDSPHPSQASEAGTPLLQTHEDSDTHMNSAASMDQDTPSNLTPVHAQQSPVAITTTGAPLDAQQQQLQSQQPSSMPSAPSTPPSNPSGHITTSSAPSPMSGVVSTSTPPHPTTTSSVIALEQPPSSATASVPTAAGSAINADSSETFSMSGTTSAPVTLAATSAPVVQQASSAPSSQVTQTVEKNQQQQVPAIQEQQKQGQAQTLPATSVSTPPSSNVQAEVQARVQAQQTSTLPTSLLSASGPAASVAQHNLAVGAALQSRKEEELNRKDRTLAEFLPMMENYNPIIPDAVTDYYLSRTGFDCDDVRIKRLLALAAQKFISDIATDAFQYCKVRQQSQKRAAPGKEKKTVLTMEDLSDALGEYGINVKKPDYYL